ncbi:family 43 glycosylhydrolase [Nonomuraea sp. NPDC049269]|uniref:family 43 glycosylhydrolase n=1 Tax=Nonomuraea sp. NPDC049269 TaxID=3364349 RepID=UPI003715BFDC
MARIDPERGHCVSVARARSPRGPYESAPGNPILTHRSTNRPIQSTGHGDLVQAADGACR